MFFRNFGQKHQGNQSNFFKFFNNHLALESLDEQGIAEAMIDKAKKLRPNFSSKLL
jgi:hypothetical protein